ncbi:uncharacterized protein LOC144573713 [Carex rostrata]
MSSTKGKEKEASSSGTKHPPHGRNKYIKLPDTPEERPVIRWVGYRAFIGEKTDVTKNINKIISQCARLYFPEATNRPNIAMCTKYVDFPDQTKLEVQAEFLKHFQFPPKEDMAQAWQTFSSIANKFVQNMLNKCKDDAKDKGANHI